MSGVEGVSGRVAAGGKGASTGQIQTAHFSTLMRRSSQAKLSSDMAPGVPHSVDAARSNVWETIKQKAITAVSHLIYASC